MVDSSNQAGGQGYEYAFERTRTSYFATLWWRRSYKMTANCYS